MAGFLGLDGLFNWNANNQGRFVTQFFDWKSLTPQQKMARLDTYYENNLLYNTQEFLSYFTDSWMEGMKPLRTPVHRSVNFYAAKILQGNPRILVKNKNPKVVDALTSFFTWSAFDDNKLVALRKDALYGNVFKKVVYDDGKVYEEVIDPKFVTSFNEDERGFIEEIRIDIPQGNNKTYTEYWTAEGENGGYVSTWTHMFGANAPLDSLGTPDFYAYLKEYGIDFVPIVHIKFNDIGNKYGASCVDHAIVKIDEVNRKMTRLSQLLFQYNKPIWAVVTGRDDAGRPLPPPILNTKPTQSSTNADKGKQESNDVIYLPGADMKSLIPDIKWADALAIIQADEKELEKDLPELRYFDLQQGGSRVSGLALQLLLAGSYDKAKEAQERFISGQVKLNKMALTIGQNMRVQGFEGLGMYENGDFDHALVFDEIIPTNTQSDKATMLAQLTPITEMSLQTKMTLAGYSTEEIALASPAVDMLDSVKTPDENMADVEDKMDMPEAE